MLILLIVIGWVLCGIPAYGLVYGYFAAEFPQFGHKTRVGDILCASLHLITGPIGLLAALTVNYLMDLGYSIRFTPVSREESKAAYEKAYGPYLKYEDYEAE